MISGEKETQSVTVDEMVMILEMEKKDDSNLEKLHVGLKHTKFFTDFLGSQFKSMSLDTVYQLCSVLRFERFEKGDIVFLQNQKSNDKLYLIIEGDVIVFRAENLKSMLEHNMIYRTTRAVSKKKTKKEADSEEIEELKEKDHKFLQKKIKAIGMGLRMFRRDIGSLKVSAAERKSQEINKIVSSNGEVLVSPVLTRRQQILKHLSTSKADRPFERENSEKRESIIGSKSKLIRLSKLDQETINQGEMLELNREEITYFTEKFGNLINQMKVGDFFGERALVENAVRSATIVCKRKCIFVILEKKDFLPIIDGYRKVLKLRREMIYNIFKECNIGYSTKIMDNILYCFVPHSFKKGENIIEEKKPGSKIFLLEDGELLVSKTVNFSLFQKEQQMKINVCKLENGSFAGEEILFSEECKYIYTCKVISNKCSVLIAMKSTLEAKIPLEMLNYIWMNFGTKETFRSTILEKKLQDFKGAMLNENHVFYTKNKDLFPAIHKPIVKQMLSKNEDKSQKFSDPQLETSLKEFKRDANYNRNLLQERKKTQFSQSPSKPSEKLNNNNNNCLSKNVDSLSGSPEQLRRESSLRKTNLMQGCLDVNELVEIHNKFIDHIPHHSFLGAHDNIKINMFAEKEDMSVERRLHLAIGGDFKQNSVKLGRNSSFLGSNLSQISKKKFEIFHKKEKQLFDQTKDSIHLKSVNLNTQEPNPIDNTIFSIFDPCPREDRTPTCFWPNKEKSSVTQEKSSVTPKLFSRSFFSRKPLEGPFELIECSPLNIKGTCDDFPLNQEGTKVQTRQYELSRRSKSNPQFLANYDKEFFNENYSSIIHSTKLANTEKNKLFPSNPLYDVLKTKAKNNRLLRK